MDYRNERRKGLVSIIISTYNYGKYIQDTLDGIKDQTYPNLEVIIIDDCSTDNTQLVVEQWCKDAKNRFENLLYLKLPRNSSSSWALNIGFQLAKGEYIVIHDSDDISHPEKIEKQVKYLIKNPNITAVGTKFKTFNDTIDKMLWPATWLSYDIKEIEENYKKKPIKHCVSFGTLLFRANIIDIIIGCKKISGVANDILFLKDIVSQNYLVDNINEILFYVRLHSERRKPEYNIKRHQKKIRRKKIKGRVSIIIPITNNSKNILNTLQSIANQSYFNIEVIIVDDGCNDNIESKIKKWYIRYKKINKTISIQDIIYFKLPISVGYPWTYNIGAYLSKGEYVMFHGDNGKSTRDKIKRQIKFLRNNPKYSVVGTNFNGNTKEIRFGSSIKYAYMTNEIHCVNINTIMIRSYVIDEILGLSKKVKGREDFEFIYRLLYHGYKTENLKNILYYE